MRTLRKNQVRDIENRLDIEHLVKSFYETAITDEVIGHFFTEVVSIQWEEHIPIICDFWEGILFGKAIYKRNPMIKHIELDRKSRMESKHFQRWITLWEENLRRNFKGEVANMAVNRARQIGQLMEMKVSNNHNLT